MLSIPIKKFLFSMFIRNRDYISQENLTRDLFIFGTYIFYVLIRRGGEYIQSRHSISSFSRRNAKEVFSKDTAGHTVQEHGSPLRNQWCICVPKLLRTAQPVVVRYVGTTYIRRQNGRHTFVFILGFHMNIDRLGETVSDLVKTAFISYCIQLLSRNIT
jgi:hypothetical protein